MIIDLMLLNLGDEILGPILEAGRNISISPKNFILCGLSPITKTRLTRLGCDVKILTIKDTAKEAIDSLN